MNTLMGMGTVFAVLILISLVISCFKIFPYLESKKKAGQTENAVKETVQDIPAEQQDNTELIAVIAAAINCLKIKSAKKEKGERHLGQCPFIQC